MYKSMLTSIQAVMHRPVAALSTIAGLPVTCALTKLQTEDDPTITAATPAAAAVWQVQLEVRYP